MADARCVQVAVTRASRVRWRDGACALEDEGELRAHVLGCGEERLALTSARPSRCAPTPPSTSTCSGTGASGRRPARCVAEADPGGLVLVDGDLQPDWRLPPSVLGQLLEVAADRGVGLAGVTKHSSLARGGAPLLGRLEREGERLFGPTGHVVGQGGHAPDPTSAPASRSWSPGSTPTPASPSASTCPPGPTPRPCSVPCRPCPTTPPSPATPTR